MKTLIVAACLIVSTASVASAHNYGATYFPFAPPYVTDADAVAERDLAAAEMTQAIADHATMVNTFQTAMVTNIPLRPAVKYGWRELTYIDVGIARGDAARSEALNLLSSASNDDARGRHDEAQAKRNNANAKFRVAWMYYRSTREMAATTQRITASGYKWLANPWEPYVF